MSHHKHSESSTANRAEAAEHLRELADQIEAGSIDLEGSSLEVPDELEYEFEVKLEDGHEGVECEVEIELKWVDAELDIEDAETPHGTSLVETEPGDLPELEI